ncbi:MAG: hypothetical protein DI626_10750, partial [Micavibrio aeruginosavorus]
LAINNSLTNKKSFEGLAQMPAAEYILAPKDGGLEKTLSSQQVKSLNFIDDTVKQMDMSEKLEQRGVYAPFWLCNEGVLVHGTAEQARIAGRVAEDMTYDAPKKSAGIANIADHFGANAGKRYLTGAAISKQFGLAASDVAAPVSTPKLRPSVRGDYGRSYAMAA